MKLIKSKKDIQRLLFDKEQVRIYTRIKEARAAVDSFQKSQSNSMYRHDAPKNTKNLGPIHKSRSRAREIEMENRRLVQRITEIQTNKLA